MAGQVCKWRHILNSISKLFEQKKLYNDLEGNAQLYYKPTFLHWYWQQFTIITIDGICLIKVSSQSQLEEALQINQEKKPFFPSIFIPSTVGIGLIKEF